MQVYFGQNVLSEVSVDIREGFKIRIVLWNLRKKNQILLSSSLQQPVQSHGAETFLFSF